jgi:hypothetical protein
MYYLNVGTKRSHDKRYAQGSKKRARTPSSSRCAVVNQQFRGQKSDSRYNIAISTYNSRERGDGRPQDENERHNGQNDVAHGGG